MTSIFWEDLRSGSCLPDIVVPMTASRLVIAAGSNRDFNGIHVNREMAEAAGAPDVFANNHLLQGFWERAVRSAVGSSAVILALRSFRMVRLNIVGSTLVVSSRVGRLWPDPDGGFVELRVECSMNGQVTVGPGRVLAALPRRGGHGGTGLYRLASRKPDEFETAVDYE